MSSQNRRPGPQGLYHPRHEHDACGVGLVVDVKGRRSRRIIRQAFEVLRNLNHRGACGCETNTGDGAGILLQIPDTYYRRIARQAGIDLPPLGLYGTGLFFTPEDANQRTLCEEIVERAVAETGQRFLGWRDVPTDNSMLGQSAKAAEPCTRQAFVACSPEIAALPEDHRELAFERRLFVARKLAEKRVATCGIHDHHVFYCTGLSSRTVVYKGMLSAEQVDQYYPELTDPAVESALAVVHSRFSTNTFPSWDRAHPYRHIAHNGEFNTLRGNYNAVISREAFMACPALAEDLKPILPVIDPDGSDSAMFDNVLEFLVMAGRSLPHAVMMLIPEAWNKHETMSLSKRAFYEYHSCLLEPWDGPAAVVFTDGRVVGATLDRNGLRPARYYVTHDDLVVLASEVGVLPEIAPEQIRQKGRLQPGRMFLVDTREGRIVDDTELKERIAADKPYANWLSAHLLRLEDLPEAPPDSVPGLRQPWTDGEHDELTRRLMAFGYTQEDQRILLAPMAELGEEAIGSMGTDTPLPVLSEKPQLLYSYFKQLFAQVTNPPLDAIREELVTSMEITIGPEGNLLDPRPESCRQLKLRTPILSNEELAKIRANTRPGLRAATVGTLWPVAEGAAGMRAALDRIGRDVEKAAVGTADTPGAGLVILSDRGVDAAHAPVPALLAIGAVHHHLIRVGRRGHVGLILETGEARETHHFALLIGYGAGAVNPYLAFESLADALQRGTLGSSAGTSSAGISSAASLDYKKAVKNYIKAAEKGVLKILSKMGISTIQSYRGAQIFEAIGLSKSLVETYFVGTDSRLDGIGLEQIAEETLSRHRHAYPARPGDATPDLDSGGQYQYRRDGEFHAISPEVVHKLQYAVRKGDYDVFREYVELVDRDVVRPTVLRGLLDFDESAAPIPLSEVEPASVIVRRFSTGAMSYGAISSEAHETLAIAMNRIGARSNTGEGGEDAERFRPDPNGDLRRSSIKQVASGRFGVTSEYLVNSDDIQIKIAQGAKPGEGGQLPGKKVWPWIAKVRLSTPGVGLISPPPHHDIYSIEDLAQLIHDLKNANPRARISVKLVSEVGVGTVAAGVAKAHADVILISGFEGGTGASPQSSIKHAGIPWEMGLSEAHQILVLNKLRSRVVLQTDGQMKTGRDAVVAALLGAEEYGFSTAALIAEGCVMMRVCHLDTCPVGVATQNPELRKLFTGKPEHIVNLMMFLAEDVRRWMAKLGFRSVDEMIGRTDRLKVRPTQHPKARHLNFGLMLHRPEVPADVPRRKTEEQDHGLAAALDNKLIWLCREALRTGTPMRFRHSIRNVNRTVGTMLGSELTRSWGGAGLPDDTIRIDFDGSAGNSFAAFLPRGITLTLEGDACDYVGKGLSGGKIAVFPPKSAGYAAERNILIGNVALYGATSGHAFFRGIAGERFAVRNSGALAVVEGVGDHGCEYMTGGRVVILGSTGRNFAAGMSGGFAYVLDADGGFRSRCNTGMVDVEALSDDADRAELLRLIELHALWTASPVAQAILNAWSATVNRFVKVVPRDYRRVLDEQKKAAEAALSATAAAAG